MTKAGIRSLSNQKMPFFEIDVSCDNGAFQTYRPCMGEALLTATGGAIATMMHAPEARGTMCKQYMVQASVALKEGKLNRVGSVYTASLMAAQAMDPDDYAVQGYNVFGDPTLKLPFAAGAPPSPTPTPVPTPPPTPTPGHCHAISALASDDWCESNCHAGFCPTDLCKCDSELILV